MKIQMNESGASAWTLKKKLNLNWIKKLDMTYLQAYVIEFYWYTDMKTLLI